MATLIVPGLHGSEPEHWQSRWQAELPDTARVEQANWSEPQLEDWLERLADHVRRVPGALLVGHSLGATLIVHLAARHPELPVGGALLVAPADPDLPKSRVPGLASFAPLPLRPLGFPAILVASRTDRHMALSRACVLANVWEAGFVDAGDAGHINVASGYGDWPAGRRLLGQLRATRQVPTRPAPPRPPPLHLVVG